MVQDDSDGITHSEAARALLAGSGRQCPGCGKPLTDRQRACSGRCRATLSHRRKSNELQDRRPPGGRDRRVGSRRPAVYNGRRQDRACSRPASRRARCHRSTDVGRARARRGERVTGEARNDLGAEKREGPRWAPPRCQRNARAMGRTSWLGSTTHRRHRLCFDSGQSCPGNWCSACPWPQDLGT
jgi:hypothetical protein